MSIKDNLLKIKSKIVIYKLKDNIYLKTVTFALILGLVFVFSFQLGKLASLKNTRAPIVLGSFEMPTQASTEVSKEPKKAYITEATTQKTSTLATVSQSVNNREVVGSKQGKIYHLPNCPGAKNISPENKITFASQDLAQKAGYLPAKNCKGLSADQD